MQIIKSFLQTLEYSIPRIGVADIIDMVVVAFLVYKILSTVRSTNAKNVGKGLLFLVLAALLTSILQLNAMNYIISQVLELGVLALVIIFQPEIRRFLEKMGSRRLAEWMGNKDSKSSSAEQVVEIVVNACEILSRDRIGALIVLEREMRLDEYFNTGTELDSRISVQLLRSVFHPNTALHDGAAIVRGDRVAAASCVLPLTANTHLNADLGTRHRAGVGMSEASDAVVVIVSEETGTISVAVGGMLKRHLAPQMLQRLLKNELVDTKQDEELTLGEKIKAFLVRGGNKNEER
ncbi:MAG: diadenylate cyclase CdaA [Oscillospiraceae bacterium]|nr:diadenylate cyclase CdaA [Oscillospiraceae bacterium]